MLTKEISNPGLGFIESLKMIEGKNPKPKKPKQEQAPPPKLKPPPRVSELPNKKVVEKKAVEDVAAYLREADLESYDDIRMHQLTYDEMVTQNMQEIFLVYCRAHMLQGKHRTFEEIK